MQHTTQVVQHTRVQDTLWHGDIDFPTPTAATLGVRNYRQGVLRRIIAIAGGL